MQNISPLPILNSLVNVNKPIPIIVNTIPNITFFSGICFKNIADNIGMKMTVRHSKKPALETLVYFVPKVAKI